MPVIDEPGTEANAPGAMEELVADPASRKRFFKMMGGAGAASAFSIVLAACGSKKKSASTAAAPPAKPPAGGDLAIVNYALTLEYIEAAFYKDVIASGLFKGKQQALLKVIGAHEQAHVVALTAATKKLGGKPVPKPKTKFPLKDAKSVVALAATVENLGAAAYLGQAGAIQSKEILAAALSIHTVEARHAAALNTLAAYGFKGPKPFTGTLPNGAFAKPASMSEVLPIAKQFIVA